MSEFVFFLLLNRYLVCSKLIWEQPSPFMPLLLCSR
ncbi:hypothetical protein LINPERHAP2_LOCUS116 [Linum perenne]